MTGPRAEKAPLGLAGSVVVFDGESGGEWGLPSGRSLAVVVAGPLEDGSYDLDCAPRVAPGSIRQVEPGEVVEYYSNSLQAWIPAKVLGRGKAKSSLDLDCKEDADVRRVRLPGGKDVPFKALVPAKPSPSKEGLSQGGGPLELQPGESCFYRSATYGWLPAEAVRFRPEDQTYDLNVKPNVPPESIRCIKPGDVVEYQSTSSNAWIPARVKSRCGPGTFELDCKPQVPVSRLRPLGHEAAGDARSQAPEAPGQPAEDRARASATLSKLTQLRQAVREENAVELRHRLESQSVLKLVGDELDQASHLLWALEARPAALAELRRATRARDKVALQAAIEAAGAAGVEDAAIEAAAKELNELRKLPLWRFDAGDGVHLDLRSEPSVNAQRVRSRLNPGDVFCAAEERRGADGILYLRLADGRGWAFEQKPDVCKMCRRFEVHEEDAIGRYVVIHNGARVMPSLASLATAEPIAELLAGMVVEVLAVSQRTSAGCIRGRISHPPGWMMLMDEESGERWAVRQTVGAKPE